MHYGVSYYVLKLNREAIKILLQKQLVKLSKNNQCDD